MEHVEAWLVVPEMELDNAALGLTLGNQVDRPECRRQRRALVIVVEEIAVQVEGIDRIELNDVDEIEANRLVLDDPPRRTPGEIGKRVDALQLSV
jgi:hypothetical protein